MTQVTALELGGGCGRRVSTEKPAESQGCVCTLQGAGGGGGTCPDAQGPTPRGCLAPSRGTRGSPPRSPRRTQHRVSAASPQGTHVQGSESECLAQEVQRPAGRQPKPRRSGRHRKVNRGPEREGPAWLAGGGVGLAPPPAPKRKILNGRRRPPETRRDGNAVSRATRRETGLTSPRGGPSRPRPRVKRSRPRPPPGTQHWWPPRCLLSTHQ